MVPEAAFVGSTVPIDQVTLWFEALITIAVNFSCSPAPKIYTLSLHDALPIFYRKNAPLTTALFPAVRVTLIFACPEMFHTKYIPLEKLEMRSEERRVGKECRCRWMAYA